MENHIQNAGEKLFPDPFLKTQNKAYLWINSFIQFVVVCQVEEFWDIVKLSCRSLARYKDFLRNNRRSGASLPASYYTILTEQILWLPLLLEILGIVIVSEQVVTSQILKLTLYTHLIKPFFLHYQEIKTKNRKNLEWKEPLRSNKKHLIIIFKGFHWSK